MVLGEYLKPEVQVIAFDIDDVRMDQTIFSKLKIDRKSIFADDLLVDFWDDGV